MGKGGWYMGCCLAIVVTETGLALGCIMEQPEAIKAKLSINAIFFIKLIGIG